MKKKRKFRLSLGKISVVFVVVALSAIAFNRAFAIKGDVFSTAINWRKSTTDLQQPVVTPTLIRKPADKAGWQTITDAQAGFTLNIPNQWYELDTSKLRDFYRICFSPVSGDNLTKPQVCVEENPWIDSSYLKTFASNSLESQEKFFNEISKEGVDKINRYGAEQIGAVRRFQIDGHPAIEIVEVNSPSIEGTEPFYMVSRYIKRDEGGLILISINADDIQQFQEHEETLLQVAESFAFNK